MSLKIWAIYAFTEMIMWLKPGPAVLLVLSQGLARGVGASVWTNLGILTGNAVYFALSAAGLGALLVASYQFLPVIRWIVAAYLVWLGVMAFFGRSKVLSVPAGPSPAAGRGWMLVNGFLLQVASPRTPVFFVALLPQFIDPAGSLATQVILGGTSVVIEFFVLLAYGVAAGRANALAARPRVRAWADRLAGTMLIVAGVGLARARHA